MRKPRVAIPWALPVYIPANAFHPLYRPFVERPGECPFEFTALNEPTTVEFIEADSQFVFRTEREFELWRATAHGDSVVQREVDGYYTKAGLAWTHAFPAELEFHHTCGAYLNKSRPSVFHCESFLPIFTPIMKQGSGAEKCAELGLDNIRAAFLPKFEHDNTLVIASHVRETLDQISTFFRSSIVDRKLHHVPIGLPRSNLNLKEPRRARDNTPRFLFTSSAHQLSSSFRLRGGWVVLRFLDMFKRSGRPGAFVFRCARPTDADLRRAGLNPSIVIPTPDVSITWKTEYMSDAEIGELFASSDFYCLPSANLHSTSIMQAMAGGAVPIVTDTQGTSEFVTDNQDGIVLSGVREGIWEFAPEFGVWFDRHDAFPFLEQHLAEAMFTRVCALLDDPSREHGMRSAGQHRARTNFSAEPHVEKFWSLVDRSLHALTQPSREAPLSGVLPLEALTTSTVDVDSNFAGPPHPVPIGDAGDFNLYRLRSMIWAVHKDVLGSFDSFHSWSPLSARIQLHLSYGKVILSGSLERARALAEEQSSASPVDPVIVATFPGVNVLQVRDCFIVLRQDLGPVDVRADVIDLLTFYGDKIAVSNRLESALKKAEDFAASVR